ncbi:MAG: SdrD B-like domain-containing protein, partial [Aerococcus suis]|nr:SdrD B-like domain-containing protein [Aerococcus suis]
MIGTNGRPIVRWDSNQQAIVQLSALPDTQATYVVVQEGPKPSETGDYILGGVFRNNGSNDEAIGLFNATGNVTGSATGDAEQGNYTIGNYVWFDEDRDGIQDSQSKGVANTVVILRNSNSQEIARTVTDSNGNYQFTNLSNGQYYVEFVPPEGYLVTTTNSSEDRELDSNGTYTSVVVNNADDLSIDLGLVTEQPGSFIENHIYQTVDEEGNVLRIDAEDNGINNQEGTSDETYRTAQRPRDGYHLVEVRSETDGVVFNTDGSQAQGNFVAGQQQEVTYIYERVERTVEEPGSFIENHIYQTVDADGNVVSVDKDYRGQNEQEGTPDEQYTTQERPEEGYELVEVSTTEENPATYNEDGSETQGNFISGVRQEVTYVYQRTEETPDKPGEETPDKPGEETPDKPGEETPDKPGEETPDKPGEETPDKPGEETPDKPGEETPDKPGEETPDKPGEETPGEPGEETPDKPGEETPDEPGEENPDKPSEEAPQRAQSAQAEKASALPSTGTAVAGAVVGVAAVLAGGLMN